MHRHGQKVSPVSPVGIGVSPAPPGTKFINDDNGLDGFFRFVPGVPGKNESYPKESGKEKTNPYLGSSLDQLGTGAKRARDRASVQIFLMVHKAVNTARIGSKRAKGSNMKMIDLARELGISTSMVSRLAKRGMPTDSVERAARWRRRHLEPGRIKRPDAVVEPPAPRAPKAPPAPSPARLAVDHLLDYAAEVVQHGGDLAPLAPALRAALASVPPVDRPAILLPFPVLDFLVAPVLTIVKEFDSDAGESMSDEDAEWMGAFWYSVAAGEIALVPAAAPD